MSKPTELRPEWRDFAVSDRQRQVFDQVVKEGSNRKAAEALGCHPANVNRIITSIKEKAALHGEAPGHFDSGVAPGFRMGKVTIQRGPDGVERVWERQHPDHESYVKAIEDAIGAFVDAAPPLKVPRFTYAEPDRDIIPWFQIGDAHLGMVAWMLETGHNFDLSIGAAEIVEAFKALLEKCSPGERCVINDLGDATHYENFKAETERGGHKLDGDGRFPKMIRVYVQVMRAIIDLALEKFEHVDVIVNQGNHSRTNDIWMTIVINALYGETGRVRALANESVFIGYLMGKTFVMTHHSDKCSGEKLVDVMFKDFADEVRHAEFLYVDTGHIHHKQVTKERGLVQIECWNNLAPNDKHHHDAGYRSRQSMSVVLRSRTYGERGRFTVPVQEVWDRLSRTSPAPTSQPRRYTAVSV